MPKDQEWHELNDRVTRLAARVAALDGLQEDMAQPAVLEVEASTAIAGHAVQQMAATRRGRELLEAEERKRETAETPRRGEEEKEMGGGEGAVVAPAGELTEQVAPPSPQPSPKGRGGN